MSLTDRIQSRLRELAQRVVGQKGVVTRSWAESIGEPKPTTLSTLVTAGTAIVADNRNFGLLWIRREKEEAL